MNEDEKECSLIFIFLSFLRRVEVNCISQSEISRKIKRPSQGQVPYPSTLYIPYLSMYRPRPRSLPRSLARLLAELSCIHTINYICYNTFFLLFNTLRYTLFHMHVVQKKSLPSHDGRLIERMNDHFLHAHMGSITRNTLFLGACR